MLSQNPCDADEIVEGIFNEEYYQTLSEEDKLYSETPDEKQLDYIKRIVAGVQEHTAQLDGYIEKYSVGWKINRISATATAIMRVAMFEVLYMPEVPERAAINEAIELSKHYETPETCAFINGILGSFSRSGMKDETVPDG